VPASRRLDRLEVEPVDRASTYERFDFPDDLDVERRLEAPFLAASSSEAASGAASSASAHASQACQ